MSLCHPCVLMGIMGLFKYICDVTGKPHHDIARFISDVLCLCADCLVENTLY